jgi:hypothetical protein
MSGKSKTKVYQWRFGLSTKGVFSEVLRHQHIVSQTDALTVWIDEPMTPDNEMQTMKDHASSQFFAIKRSSWMAFAER